MVKCATEGVHCVGDGDCSGHNDDCCNGLCTRKVNIAGIYWCRSDLDTVSGCNSFSSDCGTSNNGKYCEHNSTWYKCETCVGTNVARWVRQSDSKAGRSCPVEEVVETVLEDVGSVASDVGSSIGSALSSLIPAPAPAPAPAPSSGKGN